MPEQHKTIDDIIEKLKTSQYIPGIAIAIIKDGEVIKKITSGYSNVESHTTVTSKTAFQLSSTTKSFTSVAVLMLVQDGRLQLTDKVGNLLDGLPPAWKNVTIRQLLSHTSGLPDITRVPGKLDLIADTWDKALKLIWDAPFQFSPGEKWSYNQTNYVLLDKIIEKTSGLSLEQFMKERIFEPLDMKGCFYGAPRDSTQLVATNYERFENVPLKIRDLTFPRYVSAAGGLWCSLDVLIKWNKALDSTLLLNDNYKNEMWTDTSLNDGSKFRIDGKTIGYGLGWVVDDAPESKSVGHSGGNSTAYKRFINEHFTIIVLHNGVYNPDEIIELIATIMRGKSDETEAPAQERLWEASKSGDTAEIIRSLDDKADIEALDKRKSKSGRRALNWAAWYDQPEAVSVLLRHGANINAQNNTGFTALHHAAEAGSLKAAKVLLEAGADTRIVNKSGNTPSKTARSNNHVDISYLIDSIERKK